MTKHMWYTTNCPSAFINGKNLTQLPQGRIVGPLWWAEGQYRMLPIQGPKNRQHRVSPTQRTKNRQHRMSPTQGPKNSQHRMSPTQGPKNRQIHRDRKHGGSIRVWKLAEWITECRVKLKRLPCLPHPEFIWDLNPVVYFIVFKSYLPPHGVCF